MHENIKKLVTALKSGEYEQTTGALRKESGFCCLGVACDIYHNETGFGKWIDGDIGWSFEIGEDRDMALLPDDVAEYFGWNARNPFFGKSSLATQNDNGATFADIAKTLETREEGLE